MRDTDELSQLKEQTFALTPYIELHIHESLACRSGAKQGGYCTQIRRNELLLLRRINEEGKAADSFELAVETLVHHGAF